VIDVKMAKDLNVYTCRR